MILPRPNIFSGALTKSSAVIEVQKSSIAHNSLKPILVKGRMMPSKSFYCSHLSFYWNVYCEGNALYPFTLPTINNSLRGQG